MISISPELALIDPELAASARASLPDPSDCLARRPRPIASLPERFAPPAPTVDPVQRHGPGRSLRSAIAAGAWVLLAGIVVSPLLAFLPPHEAPTIGNKVPATSPRLRGGQGQATVRAGATIGWRAVPGASFYNLVLVRGTERVDFWPSQPSARVTRSAPRPGNPSAPVTYTWFVYPAFAPKHGEIRFGALVAHGLIEIRPGTLRSRGRTAPLRSHHPKPPGGPR